MPNTPCLGDAGFGDKSVIDLARNFSEASKQNPCWFEPPRNIFAFFDGVTQSVAGGDQHIPCWYTLHQAGMACILEPV